MEFTWKAIAIVGVWIGVGLVGLHDSQGWVGFVAMAAMIATLVIALQ